MEVWAKLVREFGSEAKTNVQTDVAIAERLIFADAGHVTPSVGGFVVEVDVEGRAIFCLNEAD